MKYRWYDMTPDEVAHEYDVDLSKGLSRDDVKFRLKKYRKNDLFEVKDSVSTGNYLSYALCNIPVFLLIIVCIIGAIINGHYTVLSALVALTFSLLTVFLVYARARKILERNINELLPVVKVMREGELCAIRQDAIVPGDIVILSAGDIVPCDCRLIDDENLVVRESSEDGMTHQLKKNASFISNRNIPIEEQANMLHAASIVMRGKAMAIAVATGDMTQLVYSGKKIPVRGIGGIKIIDKLSRISRVISTVLTAFLFICTLYSFVFETKLEIFDLFTLTLAFCVSAISDFLPVLSMIILSFGIINAEKGNKKGTRSLKIKNNVKFDELQKVDCLVFHKESLYCEKDIDLTSVLFSGALSESPIKSDEGIYLLKCAIVSRGIYGIGRTYRGDISDKATLSQSDEILIKKAKKLGIYNRKIDEEFPLKCHVANQVFLGKKYDVSIIGKSSGMNTAIVCGSTADILNLCKYEKKGSSSRELDKNRRLEIVALCDKKIRNNCTVFAISSKSNVRDDLHVPVDTFSDMVFEGLLFIDRPVLRGALQNISDAKAAGIRLIMLCPDDGEPDYDHALNLGIVSKKDECVDLKTLSSMSGNMLRTNIPIYNLYKGLDGRQIKFVIDILQNDLSLNVCYLGRELSDILPITSARVGMSEYISPFDKMSVSTDENGPFVPMNTSQTSKSGCEALGFVSDVTVTKPDSSGDGGFNSMISALTASKGVHRNIFVMCAYLAIVFTARIAAWVMINLGYIYLTPFHMIFSGCICDLLAVIMIAFEKSDSRALYGIASRRKSLYGFPIPARMILTYSITSLLLTFVYTSVIVILSGQGTIDISHITAIIFISGFFAKAALIPELSSRTGHVGGRVRIYNIYPLFIAVALLVFIPSFLIPSVSAFTGIVMPSGIEWVFAAIPAIFVIAAFEIAESVGRRRYNIKLVSRIK